jgi:hypothetical protein
MKKIIFASLSVSLYLMVISSTCDSPVVGDHSGAPGETNCSGCHTTAPVNPDIPDLHFEVGNNDSIYTPGNTYLVHLSIKRIGHNKFGFVCSTLDTMNNSKGAFGVIDAINTRKYTLGGRNYFSHTPCGADSQDSISWTFNWTAPSTNAGKIKFYMSMLVANHDEALTGDTTYTKVLSLLPSAPSGVNELSSEQKAKVYPTFFKDEINIYFNSTFDNTIKELILMNRLGQVIQRKISNDTKTVLKIDKSLSGGIYFLKIKYASTSEVVKIVKQD